MEKQIIKLYEAGYSQKEICNMLDLKFIYTNAVLTENGFDTKSYRKIPDSIKNFVCFMIKEGFQQKTISDILDISIHVVRDICYHNNLQKVAILKRMADENNQIILMYQDGKNITEISNALYADRNRIKNVLIDSGVYVPPTIKDKQILEAYKNGSPIADIIKEYNTGYRRVKRIVNEFERRKL